MCGFRLLFGIVLLPLALFGAAVLAAGFIYWQNMLPQKHERAIRAGLRAYQAELNKPDARPSR